MDTPDFELLARWRAGDRDAGSVLLERHFRSVYLFFSNKIAASPDDLIQDTFRACVEGRDRIREATSFRAYLLATARYQLYMYFRRHRPTVPLDPDRDTVEQLLLSPSRMVVRKRQHRVLLAALRSVPLEQQILLELFYWEDLTAADIATVIDVPVGTAKSRLKAARAALASRFARLAEGYDFHSTTQDDLERWVRSIREEVAVRRGAGPT